MILQLFESATDIRLVNMANFCSTPEAAYLRSNREKMKLSRGMSHSGAAMSVMGPRGRRQANEDPQSPGSCALHLRPFSGAFGTTADTALGRILRLA